jgi:hypothetical protein
MNGKRKAVFIRMPILLTASTSCVVDGDGRENEQNDQGKGALFCHFSIPLLLFVYLL